jgi:hypothetical protein
VQEVRGSNPRGPTKFLKHLQTIDLRMAVFWGPIGVQNWAGSRVSASTQKAGQIPGTSLLLNKTRHSWLKLLAQSTLLMSGFLNKPDIDPTFPARNPIFGCRKVQTLPHFSQSSQYSKPWYNAMPVCGKLQDKCQHPLLLACARPANTRTQSPLIEVRPLCCARSGRAIHAIRNIRGCP